MELVALRKHLEEAKLECIAEAGRQGVLVGDISKVLVDLGMPPILGIPQDPSTVNNIVEAVGIVLECLCEAHASGHGP
jgi:hypothetical protein